MLHATRDYIIRADEKYVLFKEIRKKALRDDVSLIIMRTVSLKKRGIRFGILIKVERKTRASK